MPIHSCRPLLALLALLATACAPSYLLGVRPAQPNTGQTGQTAPSSAAPHLETAANGVSLAVRFQGYEPQWLVFEVEYHNDSPDTVLISPAAFASIPLRQTNALPARRRVRPGESVPAAVAAASLHGPWPALPSAPLPALDPEPVIAGLQAGADQAAARARRPDWLGLALVAVSVATDIASITRSSRETRAQAATRDLLHEAAWTYTAVASARRASQAVTAEAMAGAAARLRDFALRPGRLLPGQQVRGYVYLPRFDEADGLRVLAPLGKRQVTLDFVQTHQR